MLLRAIPENQQQLDFLTSLKSFKGNLKVRIFLALIYNFLIFFLISRKLSVKHYQIVSVFLLFLTQKY